MHINNDPTSELQKHEIKSRFQSYESRKAKYLTNNAEFLRSQVQPGYTPSYVSDGAYIAPEVAVEQKDTGWHVWFVNLDQAQDALTATVTVTREGSDDTVLTSSDLNGDQPVTDFLSDVVSGFGDASPLTVAKHCDTCILITTSDDSVITGVTASIN
jgi:hypothetical protein